MNYHASISKLHSTHPQLLTLCLVLGLLPDMDLLLAGKLLHLELLVLLQINRQSLPQQYLGPEAVQFTVLLKQSTNLISERLQRTNGNSIQVNLQVVQRQASLGIQLHRLYLANASLHILVQILLYQDGFWLKTRSKGSLDLQYDLWLTQIGILRTNHVIILYPAQEFMFLQQNLSQVLEVHCSVVGIVPFLLWDW